MKKNFRAGWLLLAVLLPCKNVLALDLSSTAAAGATISAEVLAEALPLPVSGSAEAPVLVQAPLDSVQLKNGQSLQGHLGGYDAYFVEFEAADGNKQSLPWKEVADFKLGSAGSDEATMRRNLNGGASEAGAAAPVKDPALVFRKALWPGLIVHGSGYRELGDQDRFLSLVGAEIFGGMVGGFGLAKLLDAGVAQNDKDTASYLVWGGAAIFAVTWAWDLIGAPAAARRAGQAVTPAVSLSPLPGGAMLALNKAF